jgi:transcriptional regulator with XRE-family HTH domain
MTNQSKQSPSHRVGHVAAATTMRQRPRAHDLLDTDLIRRRRQELGLSREEVARASGLALTALSRLEADEGTAALNIEQLFALAAFLGLDPRDLLRGSGARANDATGVSLDPDVTRLALLLLGSNGPVTRDLAARALDWPLQRVVDTIDRLESASATLGVTLSRHGYSVKLTRLADPEGRRRLALLLRNDQTSRAPLPRTARLVYAVLHNDPDLLTATPDLVAEGVGGQWLTGGAGALRVTERVVSALDAESPDGGKQPRRAAIDSALAGAVAPTHCSSEHTPRCHDRHTNQLL